MDEDAVTQTPIEQDKFDEGHPIYLQLITGRLIRLFELVPGLPTTRLSIRISIHELEHTPEFDAISYVWGNIWDRTNITCNGRLISIPKSLGNALQRFRDMVVPRILWADAICINQGDTREKSHHVAFMNRVYSRAKNALIYMGPDIDGAAVDVSSLIEEHKHRMSNYQTITEMPTLVNEDPILHDSRWKSLALLMSNSWFSRAWVVQEAGVAQNPIVIFGTSEFSYRQLMVLNRWVVRCASQLQPRYGISMLTIHTDWEQWSEGWAERQSYPYTVVDFLSHAKGLGCQEPLDHVYAFLGHPLLQKADGSGPVLDPKYTLSMSAVYQQLTGYILTNVGLSVLSAIEHDEITINSEIPSWVVRWDMDMVQSSFGYYEPFYYRTSGSNNEPSSSTLDSFCKISGNVCFVSARPIDTIRYVYQFSSLEADWPVEEAATVLKANQMLRECLLSATRVALDAKLTAKYEASRRFDVFSLSLCAGLRNYERAEGCLDLHRTDRDAFFVQLLQAAKASSETFDGLEQMLPLNSQEFPTPSCADSYFFDLSLACKGRCFFVTDSGYVGVGPWILKLGDECVVIKGARVPFVLRKHKYKSQEKGARYRVLGECYVHGVMNGELMRGMVETEWEDTALT